MRGDKQSAPWKVIEHARLWCVVSDGKLSLSSCSVSDAKPVKLPSDGKAEYHVSCDDLSSNGAT